MQHGRIRLKALLGFCLALCALQGCGSFHGRGEDLSFLGSGGTELHGTLVLPSRAVTPVAAIVLLHGAEAATRGRMIYPLTANIFLDRGIAVFVYDKRGAGESGGSTESTTYAQLVEDAIAAVALVRSRRDIDPTRVGVFGVSESGWLTPEIAERSGGLAFVINKVGSALSVRETVAWEVYHDLMADGVEQASAREQTAIYERIWAYRLAPTDAERDALEAELARWAGREDSQLPVELKLGSESYRADLGYDPGPYLERLQTPMLYLYGSEDVNIPTAASVKRLKELAAAGRPVTFHVFDGEGHELGGFHPWPPFYAFVDGYADRLAAFALRHTQP